MAEENVGIVIVGAFFLEEHAHFLLGMRWHSISYTLKALYGITFNGFTGCESINIADTFPVYHVLLIGMQK